MIKTLYKLEENLELPEENFIIKKGSLVNVTNRFNVNDDQSPTILGISFAKINGTYTFNESDFNNLIFKNSIKALLPKFAKGDCVKSSENGQGVVKDFKPENIFGDYVYMYTVNFNSGKTYDVAEEFLERC